MTARSILSGVAYCIFAATASHAQSFPFEASVIVPEVEVRALQSMHENSYPTSKLRQGSLVTVVGEKEGGWYAIKPPAGSFSWIASKDIKAEQEPYAVVLEDGVETRLGSSIVAKKPNVRQQRLNRGEKVVLFKDKPQTDDDGTTWVMIQPPANEVRYIPRDSVRPMQRSTAEPPTGNAPLSPPPSSVEPNVNLTGDALWTEAEKAERDGRLLDAEKSYAQLAKQTNNNDLRILCHNRIHMIHQANRRAAVGYQPANGANRLAPMTASRPLAGNASPGGAASQYTYVRETSPLPAGQAPATYLQTPNGSTAAPQTRGPGLLARSSVPVGGQQGYLLDMGKGQPVLYVIPQPGVNLEQHIGRQVSVTGPIDYHNGYRQHVLRASQVIVR